MENNLPPFVGFPKISRLRRACVVTEKIDGTNAQINFLDDGTMLVGSRNRWITPDKDNFGFARWCFEHEAELRSLGPGQHFGEWWGLGIQRTYGLTEKRFSLFNSGRWSNPESGRPACCSVVPVLYAGPYKTEAVEAAMDALRSGGSVAAPGFMKPEGVVVFHTANNSMQKITFEHDEAGKDASANVPPPNLPVL